MGQRQFRPGGLQANVTVVAVWVLADSVHAFMRQSTNHCPSIQLIYGPLFA